MSGSAEKNNAEPNLTPMLDMVFQLVTFFMLVINFKAASLDLTLQLPVVGSAQPVKTEGLDLLVLNVDKQGTLKLYNLSQDAKKYLSAEAQASVLSAHRRGDTDLKYGDQLPTTVVIRADKECRFGQLNKVIKDCQDVGYRSFAFKSVNKTS